MYETKAFKNFGCDELHISFPHPRICSFTGDFLSQQFAYNKNSEYSRVYHSLGCCALAGFVSSLYEVYRQRGVEKQSGAYSGCRVHSALRRLYSPSLRSVFRLP